MMGIISSNLLSWGLEYWIKLGKRAEEKREGEESE